MRKPRHTISFNKREIEHLLSRLYDINWIDYPQSMYLFRKIRKAKSAINRKARTKQRNAREVFLSRKFCETFYLKYSLQSYSLDFWG